MYWKNWILLKHRHDPKQSTDLIQSLSKFQWHFLIEIDKSNSTIHMELCGYKTVKAILRKKNKAGASCFHFKMNCRHTMEIWRLVPDHNNKTNVTIKWVIWSFWFSHMKVMLILYCSLLYEQQCYVWNNNVHILIKKYLLLKC